MRQIAHMRVYHLNEASRFNWNLELVCCSIIFVHLSYSITSQFVLTSFHIVIKCFFHLSFHFLIHLKFLWNLLFPIIDIITPQLVTFLRLLFGYGLLSQTGKILYQIFIGLIMVQPFVKFLLAGHFQHLEPDILWLEY